MKILIAEDSLHLRRALKLAAEQFGTITLAGDGEEALGLLENEEFDIVVTDYQMKHSNGYEVARRALEKNPATPVILITAYATKDLAINSLNLNLFGFLEKPCSLEQFEAILGRAVSSVEQSLKNERLTVMGEMAETVLHEIGNPLSRILLRAERLLELAEKQPAPAMQESIRAIEDTTRRIFQIMSGVRTLLGEDLGDPGERSSLNKIFENVYEFHSKELLEQQIELRIENVAPFRSLFLHGSPVHWIQVMKCLIQNSVDAINEAPGRDPNSRWVRVGAELDGAGIMIFVEDSGSGVDESLRDQIFRPLFTTRKEIGRVGTGLSVARKIVESCGGSIVHARNKPTRFVISAPLTEALGPSRI